MTYFDRPFTPNIDGLIRTLRRQGAPDRVYNMELGLDLEVHEAVRKRFDTAPNLKSSDPLFILKLIIANYLFLGYESIWLGMDNMSFPRKDLHATDTVTGAQSQGTRAWIDEGVGMIATWEDFEKYPWPDIAKADTSKLEWLEKNLPDGMGVAASCHSVFEEVCWLMGYTHLCYQIYDTPDLVDAMFERIGQIFVDIAKLFAQFKCVKLYFGGDDMGFKTSTMIQANILRAKCLPWHKKITEIAHNAGRISVLHSCGELSDIMDAIIDDVGYDAKHSFEDVILPVTEAKKRWGHRIGLVGGIDVDFLCHATESEVRQRVRKTLDVCLPGGGYCLGSGNTIANYIPLDNYLAMLDEGRKYSCYTTRE